MTVVPHPEESGEPSYDVTAYPKATVTEPTCGGIEYTVVKRWKDGGRDHLRPDGITVEIRKNGEPFQTVLLTEEADWSYRFTVPDNGAVYTVKEQSVENYSDNYGAEGKTLMVTNRYEGSYEEPLPPETEKTERKTTDLFHFREYFPKKVPFCSCIFVNRVV